MLGSALNGPVPPAVVLGIGLSSKATAEEVRALVEQALRRRGIPFDAVACIATRECFAADPRLELGRAVAAVSDAALVAASAPTQRAVGLAARVAETAALLTAGGEQPTLIGPLERSAHVTVAVAIAVAAPGSTDR